MNVAAKNGHFEIVKSLHRLGIDVCRTDDKGADALWHAVGSSNATLDLVTYLADQGCNLHSVVCEDQKKDCLVLRACELSSVETVSYLKERGASIHAVDENGNNAAHRALNCFGNREMFEYVSGQGVGVMAENNQGVNCLMRAASAGYIDIVKKLHEEHGVDINHQDKDGNNALMWAAEGYSEDDDIDDDVFKAIILYLVEKGADIHAKQKDGKNALMLACATSKESVMRALLELGADVNAKAKDGRSCAILVVSDSEFGDDVDMLDSLAGAGADLEAVEDEGMNILHFASMRGLLEVCKWAVQRGMKPTVPDHEGYSAVMIPNSANIAEFLLDCGVDIDLEQKNHYGRTAFQIACFHGYTSVAKLFKERGARLDGLDQWGMSALHLAAYSDNLPTAKWLVMQGMELSVEDEEGHTVLDNWGSFIGPPSSSNLEPLSAQAKKNRVAMIIQARAAYTEMQRREECFQRRKLALKFLQGSGFMPTAAQREAQRAEQQQVDTFAKLEAIDRSTKEANLKYLQEEVFGHEGLRRKIVGML
jgi:ankyrin repeat protein